MRFSIAELGGAAGLVLVGLAAQLLEEIEDAALGAVHVEAADAGQLDDAGADMQPIIASRASRRAWMRRHHGLGVSSMNSMVATMMSARAMDVEAAFPARRDRPSPRRRGTRDRGLEISRARA